MGGPGDLSPVSQPKPLELDLTAAGPSCADLPAAGLPLGSKQLALARDPGRDFTASSRYRGAEMNAEREANFEKVRAALSRARTKQLGLAVVVAMMAGLFTLALDG